MAQTTSDRLYDFLVKNVDDVPDRQSFNASMQDKGKREQLHSFMQQHFDDIPDFEKFDTSLGSRNRTIPERVVDTASSVVDFVVHPKGIQRRDLGSDLQVAGDWVQGAAGGAVSSVKNLPNTVRKGYAQGKFATAINEANPNPDQVSQAYAETQRLNTELPKTDSAKMLESGMSSWDVFSRNPVGFIVDVGAESMAGMAPEAIKSAPGIVAGSMATGAAAGAAGLGAPTGGLGTAPGAVGGAVIGAEASVPLIVYNASAVQKQAELFVQELASRGVNMNDPNAIKTAFSNPSLIREIKAKVALPSSITGFFDGLSALAGGSIEGAVSSAAARRGAGKAASRASGEVADFGFQASAGMAGEGGAQVAYSGKITSPDDVIAEGLAETPVLGMASRVAKKVASGAAQGTVSMVERVQQKLAERNAVQGVQAGVAQQAQAQEPMQPQHQPPVQQEQTVVTPQVDIQPTQPQTVVAPPQVTAPVAATETAAPDTQVVPAAAESQVSRGATPEPIQSEQAANTEPVAPSIPQEPAKPSEKPQESENGFASWWEGMNAKEQEQAFQAVGEIGTGAVATKASDLPINGITKKIEGLHEQGWSPAKQPEPSQDAVTPSEVSIAPSQQDDAPQQAKKEPWETRSQDWFDYKFGQLSKKAQAQVLGGEEGVVTVEQLRAQTDAEHRQAVERALSEGKPVPQEVIDEDPAFKKQAAFVEAKRRKQAKAEVRELDIEGRPKDGGTVNPGDVFRTATGRTTTPYPKGKHQKYSSQWLIENAIAEAESRGDDFNRKSFGGERVMKSGEIPTASRDSMLMYLFGSKEDQPKVVPSILKSLAGAEKPAVPQQERDEYGDDPAQTVFRGSGRESVESAYNGTAVPILGQGKYYATRTGDAKQYGPNIETSTVGDLVKNPLIIRSDAEWRSLTKDAGWGPSNPHGMEKEDVERYVSDLKKLVISRGHDGIIVSFPDSIDDGDPAKDRWWKLLTKVFGHSTIVSYGQQNAQSAAEEVGSKPEPTTEPKPHSSAAKRKRPIEEKLTEKLLDGGFSSITEARKWYEAETSKKIEAGTKDAKAFDELVEIASVQAARQIVAEGGFSESFDKLVALYNNMPRLGVRTSESVAQQAYSTPLPLAYAASRLAGIGSLTKVYEPTAGNGILIMEASKKNAIVNELNDYRAKALEEQGFAVTKNDASEYVPDEKVDVVIANPPFGRVKDENGKSREFEVSDVYSTKEIDHAIALKALEAMSDDGKAVLILGAPKAESKEVLSDKYNSKAKREFYLWLHQHYNVVDHFIVSGDLYQKQGAGWPVDVITINGRGKSEMVVPAANVPEMISDWETLKERVKDHAENNTIGTTGGRVRESSGTSDKPGAKKPAAGVREGADGKDTGSGNRPGNTAKPPVREENVGAVQVHGAEVADSKPNVIQPTAPTAPRGENVRRPSGSARSVKEGKSQVPYKPASKSPSVGTLLPINMADAVESALQTVRDTYGDIDPWVAKELGYKNAELSKYLSAEQIDAVALAINNMKKGAGFIIGDQTGVGKGRFVASIIRWAVKNGHVPVFVTEKPDLYSDMYRDLTDTGIQEMLGREPKILITNSGQNIDLGQGRAQIKTSDGKAHEKVLWDFVDGKAQYDMLFTTYSQMQTVKGEDTGRRAAISAVAPRAVVILDESHNAGGTKKGEGMFESKEDKPADRADFVRGLSRGAVATVFSSATYAKRPEVMDLYASTDLGKSVGSIDELADMIAKGGVPMQQIIASMLSESGQYIRRERSFEGIEYRPDAAKVDRKQYDKVSSILALINDFSKQVAAATKGIANGVKSEGLMASGNQSTGGAGADSTNFTSVMHNVINQMLLSLKADHAANRAIEALKAGEKPVITVAGTLESFHNEVISDLEISDGDLVNLGFGDLLLRYLEKCRWITIKRPFMKKGEKAERRRLTDAEIGPVGVQLFKQTTKLVNDSNFSNLPISPIDWIRHRISDAGYKITEITGRKTMLVYDREKRSYLGKRPSEEYGVKGKERTKTGFNDGSIDAVILNQSGSTGISLHASKTFKDQKPRVMIITQAEGNVDTHMQMLGRVNRTGQVSSPRYLDIMADIPAEIRPAAIRAKKMASLNANTTASTKSTFTSDEVPDIINVYGDEAAYEMLMEDSELHSKLGDDLLKESDDNSGNQYADLARRMTGRIPMLPLAEQERVYEQLLLKYNDILEQAKARGENALEAQTMALDAETLESKQLQAQTGTSPFQGPVFYEKVRVNNLSKPYKTSEVMDQVAESTGIPVPSNLDPEPALRQMRKEGLDKKREGYKAILGEFQAYLSTEVGNVDDQSAAAKLRTRLLDNRNRWQEFIVNYPPGTQVELSDPFGIIYHGVVTDVAKKGNPKNTLALSTWKMRVAVASSSRQFTIPFSKLFPVGTTLGANTFSIRETYTNNDGVSVIEAFDAMRNTDKETRHIVTGNIPAGYSIAGKGTIINYTTADGEAKQGILMPRGFKLENKEVTFITGDQVIEFVHRGGVAKSGDQAIKVAGGTGGSVRIEIKASKKAGGEYYLDKQLTAITGDLVSVGGVMRAEMPGDVAAQAVDRLRGLGAKFSPDGKVDIAKNIVEGVSASGTEKESSGVSAAPAGAPSGKRSKPLSRDRVSQASDVNPEQVVKAMEDISNTPIRYGRGWFAQRRANGWFNLKNDLVRVKVANAIDTVAHEIGHSTHAKIVGWNIKFPSEVNRGLLKLGKALYGNRKPNGGYAREGFAEFFAKKLLGDDTDKSFPAIDKWFESEVLAKHPDMAKRFKAAQEMYRQWDEQGAIGRVAAMVQRVQTGPVGKLKTAYEALSKLLTKRMWVNDAAQLEKVVDQLMKETGVSLNPTENPATMRAALKMSAPGTARRFIYNHALNIKGDIVGKSLVDYLKPVKDRLEDFTAYAIAARAMVLHARGINPGISIEDAEYTVGQLKSPEFEDALKGVTEWSNHLIDYVVEAGGLSPDAAKAMRDLNPIYVPFKRFFDERYLGGAKGASSKTHGIKRMKGSGRRIMDPIDMLMLQAEQMIRFGNELLVSKAIIKATEKIEGAAGKGEVASVGWFANKVQAPMAAQSFSAESIKRQLEEIGANLEDADMSQMLQVFSTAYKPTGKDNIVAIWRNGKREFWEVDPEVYRVVMEMDKDHLPYFLTAVFGPAKRLVQLGAVGLNAAFGAIKNPIRDTAERAVYGQTKSSPVDTLVHGFWEDLKNGESAELWKNLGGEIATLMGQDRIQARGYLEEGLADTTSEKAKQIAMHPIDALRRLFGFYESSPRIAEFKAVLEKAEEKYGKGSMDARIEALLASKDVTTNFTRGGIIATALNGMIPFFNASVQGTSKFARAFSGANGQKYAVRALGHAVAYITVPSLMLAFINKDEDWYDELQKWERMAYWHFSLDGGKPPVRIPKPFQLGYVFGSIPQELFLSAYKKQPELASEALLETLKGFLPASNPLELLPALVKPSVEAWANFDSFREKSIVPFYEEKYKMPKDQYGRYQTETAKWIGEMLHVSPRKVEHVISGQTGNYGMNAIRLAESLVGIRKELGRQGGTSEIPVIGTLFSRNPYYNGRSVDKMYEMRDELDQKKGSKSLSGEERHQLHRLEFAAKRIGEVRARMFAGKIDQDEAAKRITNIARRSIGKAPAK